MRISSGDLQVQYEWAQETFGPGERTNGVVTHIRKELVEIENEPHDVTEWADVLILAFDGAMRHGYTPDDIIKAYHDKMEINYQRDWPDWRDFTEDDAIEHVRP